MGCLEKNYLESEALYRERERGGERELEGEGRGSKLQSKPCRWAAAFAESQVELEPIQAYFH